MSYVKESCSYLYIPPPIEKKILRRQRLSTSEMKEFFQQKNFADGREDRAVEERVSRQIEQLRANIAEEHFFLTKEQESLIKELGGKILGKAAEEALSLLVSAIARSIFEGGPLSRNLEDLEKDLKLEEKVARIFYKVVDSHYLEGKIEEAKPYYSSIQLWMKRRESVVTGSAISQQAGLFLASSATKKWALGKENISFTCRCRQAPSTNNCHCITEVYQLHNLKEECVAYLKRGAETKEAPSIMESLIWECALILGMEEYFVATKMVEIQTSERLLSGSIQPAQKGTKIINYILNRELEEKDLKRPQVSSALLISLVMGMYDLNPGNIIYTEEGGLKIYDNTRSFVNANGFIRRDVFMMAHSCRCCLMDLALAEEKLREEELVVLQSELAHYMERIPLIETYLGSKRGINLCQRLPKGWLDVESALSAMRSRVNRMEEAMKSREVSTLIDLVCSAYPDYRFAYAIAFLERRLENREYEDSFYHSDVGKCDHVLYTIERCKELGIDLLAIKKLCMAHRGSFADLKKELLELFNQRLPGDVERYNANDSIVRKLLDCSFLDLKDTKFNSYEGYVSTIYFDCYDIKVVVKDPGERLFSRLQKFIGGKADILLFVDGERYRLFYKAQELCRVIEIKFLYPPGRIEVGGKEYFIHDYIRRLCKNELPLQFHELPPTTEKEGYDFLLQTDKKYFFAREGDHLLLFVKKVNGFGVVKVVSEKLPVEEDGTLFFRGKRVSLSYIVDLFSFRLSS